MNTHPKNLFHNRARLGRCSRLVSCAALAAGEPYHLICLDIMMPQMDGQAALRHIRDLEEAKGIFSSAGTKIVMTTALRDMKNACTAFASLCDAYLVKPIDKTKLLETLRQLALIERNDDTRERRKP